ncbi:MAG: GIY-YIG nuclease family protein, partial [Firmicutes bacterium]|nr:GIY-YIG nuclease family protein [Bacillota bacterium]
MTEIVKREIALLPNQPGVYLMKNKDGKIIYIGKAKNLKKRVSQYFLRPQSGKVAAMVFAVDHFDTILTASEKEALILEMNLIHQHYPRYNILLKDGSHYPYIALRKGSDPYLKILRDDKDNKYKYFGPFPNSSAAYEMINLLNKLFPLRKCKTLPSVPCLYYHLGQCLAPCINTIPETVYSKLITDIDSFLSGHSEEKTAEICKAMIEA